MQEYLWEIWTGHKNTHHRTQMDASETPRVVMQRTIQELQGTDKSVPATRRDPNTGQRTEIKWKFAWRSQGEENPLKNHLSFAEQGVTPDALIVVREVEVRAHTIYIDGFDGLQAEEMAAASNKKPMIAGIVLAIVLLGGAGFYFLHWAPQQDALAPYSIDVPTAPKGASLMLILKVPKKAQASAPKPSVSDPSKTSKAAIDEKLTTMKFVTPTKHVKIPKKAKIIFISIHKKGYKPWTAGHELEKWNKDRLGLKKLDPIHPKELTVANYFPKMLEKLPKAPPIPTIAAPQPKALSIRYPRRWRRIKLGLDPMDGGLDHQGAKGITKTSAELSLAVAQAMLSHLKKQRRRYRVTTTRNKDRVTSNAKRNKTLRRKRVRLLLQIAFASGVKELPKASKTMKRDQKLIAYNDSVAGFQIYTSKDNRSQKKSIKWASCLSQAMKAAGFTPRKARKGESEDVGKSGIRVLAQTDPILGGKTPAARLVAGYISHRGENKVLNQGSTQTILGQVVEHASICYKKR